MDIVHVVRIQLITFSVSLFLVPNLSHGWSVFSTAKKATGRFLHSLNLLCMKLIADSSN